MTIEKRKELSKYLKHGDLSIIANKAGVRMSVVSKWIKGEIEKSGCAAYFELLTAKRKQEAESAINEI